MINLQTQFGMPLVPSGRTEPGAAVIVSADYIQLPLPDAKRAKTVAFSFDV
jgi:hypothetical protein